VRRVVAEVVCRGACARSTCCARTRLAALTLGSLSSGLMCSHTDSLRSYTAHVGLARVH